MDTMLIRSTIFFVGISLGSSILIDSNISVIEPTNTSLLFFESSRFKPKRELDKFNFDSSIFDDSNIFDTKDINRPVNFDIDDEDISSVIPSPSSKITKSNLPYHETKEKNLQSSKFRSLLPDPQEKLIQQSLESESDLFPDRNRNDTNKIKKDTSLFSRQTVSNIHNFATYPEYVLPKPESFYHTDAYKTKKKIVHNSYLSSPTKFIPNVPLYNTLNQANIQPVPLSSYYRNQQSYSPYAPYNTQFKHDLRPLHHSHQLYSPSNLHNQQYAAQFQNFGQQRYDNIQFTTSSPINLNKLTLPIVPTQTISSFSKYAKTLEAAPSIISSESGFKYKTKPSSIISIDYENFKNANQRSGSNTPFLNGKNTRYARVLPLHAASSTAEFPKYKGASLTQFSTNGFSKTPDDYQDFQSQPQLHFDGDKNNKNRNNKISRSKQLERIRSDVEVIDKKKPIPPLPRDDGDESKSNDEDSEEAYNESKSFLVNSEEDIDESPRRHSTESTIIEDIKSSKSYPFMTYGDAFTKHKKDFSDKGNINEEDNLSLSLGAKYHFDKFKKESKDASGEKSLHPKYKASSLHDHYGSYLSSEDDDEAETQKRKRKEKSVDVNHPHNIKKPKTRDNDKRNYEEDFEKTFRRKYKEPKFSLNSAESDHFNESRSRSHANYKKNKSPQQFSNRNRHQSYSDESGESSNTRASDLIYITEPVKNNKSQRKSKLKEKYPMKDSDLYDESDLSTYSGEETSDSYVLPTQSYGNIRKLPSITVQQYTTKSPFKISTSRAMIHPKKSASSRYTTYISHGDWNSNKKVKSLNENHSNPSNQKITSFINSEKNILNSDNERSKILRNLEGI